jgi:hypothetical protein
MIEYINRIWIVAREAYRRCLENRWSLTTHEGSNPSQSAKFRQLRALKQSEEEPEVSRSYPDR